MRRRLARRVKEQVRQTFVDPAKDERARQKPGVRRLVVEEHFDFPLHPGQERAWDSPARIVAVIAGTGGGKTSYGPYWLLREIQRRGSGDYLVVGPTLKLLTKKVVGDLKRLLVRKTGCFVYKAAELTFELTGEGEMKLFGALQEEPTRIMLGQARDSDSLESMTVKAAWLDECGQRFFKLGSWEAVQRRLARYQGRALLTTTPYNLGWLKSRIWDAWKAAPARPAIAASFVDADGQLRQFEFQQHAHEEIDCIRFESIMNPAYSVGEYERARRNLPRWKFDMMYRGLFTKPAGLIYDSFDEDAHTIARFPIPDAWPRASGHDFGGVNTAAVFMAYDAAYEDGLGRVIVYQAYKAGGRSSEGHVAALKGVEPRSVKAWGGSHQEQGWRDAYRQAGLRVEEPKILGVEEGIDFVYAAIQAGRFFVFDDLEGYLEELLTYSRELDGEDEPTEKIADKAKFHFMDATRYGLPGLLKPSEDRAPMASTRPVERPGGVLITVPPARSTRGQSAAAATTGGRAASRVIPRPTIW